MKAIAVHPGKAHSIHLRDVPEPRLDEIPDGRGVLVEVLRGYALANTVVSDALKQFPDDWSLTLARAALLHDEVRHALRRGFWDALERTRR